MNSLFNRKGTILIATYLVLLVILVVAASFFALVIHDCRSVARENEGIKALNFAEKGIAYVFYESYNSGWNWHTHRWNGAKTKLHSIPVADQQIARGDCYFDGDGFYVHNSGEFMVKAYPDKNRENDTVVLSMGINGNERRVIMYYMTQRGIYDFFVYSPDDIDLYKAVGHNPKMNGGGIHSNGSIYLSDYMRLEDISELSTGENGSIYYTSSQYAAPYYADRMDDTIDGKAPITRLDKIWELWRDDTIPEEGPFGYYGSDGRWRYKSYANYFVRDYASGWPTNSFWDTEYHFAGDCRSGCNIAPGKYDQLGILNDSSEYLNRYNVWIKPYKQDEDGNQIPDVWTQIPAELDQQWSWNKYRYVSASQQPVEFYTFRTNGTKVDVADTYWEVQGSDVVWIDPADLGSHPAAKSYWDMFKSPEFWKAVRGSTGYAGRLCQETFEDGKYGSEIESGGTTLVKRTNSRKQSSAWKQFLSDSKLGGVVREGNSGGEYLAPPDFTITYSRKAKKDGLYLGLSDAGYEDDDDWQIGVGYSDWQAELEESIDDAVDALNSGAGTKVAQKKKFMNTFTGKMNYVLEINLENMQKEGKYPKNGIVYTKVPVRFTNAEALPRLKKNYGFTVLGEENVYLQGDYNTDKWVTSAVISKKRVFTLSNDFNDPQVKPATQNYRDYPYMYVKNISGTWQESNPKNGGGMWVYYSYLDSDGSVDKKDNYPQIPDSQEKNLRSAINSKNSAYQALFHKDDPSGTQTATFSWPASGESYTYGMIPNTVTQDTTYNCLIASGRWLQYGSYDYHSNKGCILEDWGSKKRIFKGSYFQLEDGGFKATDSEFVDYVGDLPINRRGGRGKYQAYRQAKFLNDFNAPFDINYDVRFKTATRSPSDVFFGGAESLWAEAAVSLFYQMDF